MIGTRSLDTTTMPIHRFGRLLACQLALLIGACTDDGGEPPVVAPPPVQATALPTVLMLRGSVQAPVGSTLSFSSNAASLPGLTYRWEFSDGTTSTAAAVSRSFEATGERTVKLTVSNELGESRSAMLPLWIGRYADVNGVTCSGPDRTGWCRLTPDARRQMYFVDAWQGYAVGRRTMHRSSDGGLTWQELPALPSLQDGEELSSVRFADAALGWVGGFRATAVFGGMATSYEFFAYRTVDGGASWKRSQVGKSLGWAIPPRLSFTVLDARRLFVGISFTPQTQFKSVGRILATSMDGGLTWDEPVYSEQSVDSNETFPATFESALGQGKFSEPTASKSGVLWALSSRGALLKSETAGHNFTIAHQPPQPWTTFSFLSDDQRGWALSLAPTASGALTLGLWKTVDGSSSWGRVETTGLPAALGADRVAQLDFSDPLNAWLFIHAKPPAPGEVPAPGAAPPTLYRSEDGGLSWSELPLSVPFDFRGGSVAPQVRLDVLSASSARLAVAGEVPSPPYVLATSWSFLTTDGGRTWGPGIANPFNGRQYEAVLVPGTRTILMEGDDGGWFLTRDAGRIQSVVFAGAVRPIPPLSLTNVPCANSGVRFTSALHAWATADPRTMFRTTDGGQTWQAISLDTVAALDGTICLFDFDVVDEAHAWVLGTPSPDSSQPPPVSRLSRSTDGGANWQNAVDLPFVASSMRFGSPSRGLIVGHAGRLAVTNDGGQTWAPRDSGTVQDLTRLYWIDAQRVLALGRNGHVSRSVDAGEHWSLVTTPAGVELASDRDLGNMVFSRLDSGYGVKSVTTFVDARHGWIAAPGGAVLATQDGGSSWTLQSTVGKIDPRDIQASSPTDVRIVDSQGSVHATETGGR